MKAIEREQIVCNNRRIKTYTLKYRNCFSFLMSLIFLFSFLVLPIRAEANGPSEALAGLENVELKYVGEVDIDLEDMVSDDVALLSPEDGRMIQISSSDVEPTIYVEDVFFEESTTYFDSGDRDIALHTVNALPDIVIRDIVPASAIAQPYPTNALIPIRCTVQNIGTIKATNVKVSVYVDNVLFKTYNINELGAKTGGVITLECKSSSSGSHQVKVQANPDQTIAESDYSNNYATANFSWYDWPDLKAQTPTCDKGNRFVVKSNATFTFMIGNLGTAAASNIYFEILASDGTSEGVIASDTIPSLASGRGVVYTLVNQYNMALEKMTVTLSVDPHKVIEEDLNRANNISKDDFNIYPDSAIFAGQWADASVLTVGLPYDVTELLLRKCPGLTVSKMRSAMEEWNDVSNNVFLDISIQQQAAQTRRNPDILFTLSDELQGTASKPLGRTVLYYINSNGVLSRIPTSQVISMKTDYVLCDIELNRIFLEEKGQPEDYMAASLAHELGHALGLAHPHDTCKCNSFSIMCYINENSTINRFSYNVVYHDKYNLSAKYD